MLWRMPTLCCFDMLTSSQVHCCTEVLLVLTLHLKYLLAALCACNASCKALAIAISLADADDVFRLLHLTVAVLFSEQIQNDLAVLKAGKPSDVSLAAKWAPTPGSKAPLTSTTAVNCSHTACLFAAPTTQCCKFAYVSYCSLRLTVCTWVCLCPSVCVCLSCLCAYV